MTPAPVIGGHSPAYDLYVIRWFGEPAVALGCQSPRRRATPTQQFVTLVIAVKSTPIANHDADECKFSGICSAHPPSWFQIGEPLLWPTMHAALKKLSERRTGNMHLDLMPECAAIHLIHCLDTSMDTNRRGRHSVAIGLVRQCVEALTLVEIGLQEQEYRNSLLEGWSNETKSQGEIRKALERDVWGRYGRGLWTETWAEFFGEFARAVQPYAHYTQLLQGWQFASPPGQQLTRSADGNYLFLAQIGLNTYDGLKGTRITLLHCLLAWTLARILLANDSDNTVDPNVIEELGTAIGKSELLGGGTLKWHQEFWPHMFDQPHS
jgi:hypothetical protein